MVLYFSATGNSRHCARFIASRLADEAVSLNEIIKHNKTAAFNSEKPYIIVAPIYAWRLPLPVEELLKRAELSGDKRVWFVVTMGAQSGRADAYCKKIAANKGLTYMGLRGIVMPDSYVALYDMDSPEDAHRKIILSENAMAEVADRIEKGEIIKKDEKTPLSPIMSGAINKLYNSVLTSDKRFYATDACTGCGSCAVGCVMNNIEIKNGKPEFLHKCIHCMACIQNCKVRGIEIKGKTESRGRYSCPIE